MLAAHGSGAVALSSEQQCRVLNVDIGGGTTKLAVCEQGRILSTAALHVGGRLLATDDAGFITVLEPGGQTLARRAGLEWNCGDRVTRPQIETLANYMARAVLALIQDETPAPEFAQLWLTPPLSGAKSYDAVVFSGGVGEFGYDLSTISAPPWDSRCAVESNAALSTGASCPPASASAPRSWEPRSTPSR
jgi:ethanolamine utilization protein EutA